MYEAIPEELKELKQWCCFKLEQRGEKMTKIPVDANTGGFGKSNDESTWATFEVAHEAIKKYNLDGLGFYFKAPYFGIDIDGVKEDIDRYLSGIEKEQENNIVAEFIEMMGSYSEISVSGTGIHIIAKGELPEGARRKGNVEMYDSGRFFVMTGNKIGSYSQIIDDDYGRINYLHQKYLKKSEVAATSKQANKEKPGTTLSQDEIIDIALKSRSGGRFNVFMNGGWEQFYNSQSEADMAFANDLAFWTNLDFAMMDNIFRSSALMRDKWDREQNGSTYGQITLQKAIDECNDTFKAPEKDDFNLIVVEDNIKPVKRNFYSYDDTGNALRFYDAFGANVRYSYVRKGWFFYDGQLWIFDQQGMAKRLADRTITAMKDEKIHIPEGEDEEKARKIFAKHLKSTRNSNGKTNMLKEAQHLLPIQPEDFDSDIFLFNVQNGYLNLKDGKLYEHDREKFFTKISPVEYTDKIDCPLWLDFLDTIFAGDKELIEYMQRAVGYSLCGSTEEQVMFILYGNGRNGKSVFLDIITELFGSYATNIQPQTIMVKQSTSGANSDIARLNGARFVTAAESGDGVRLDEGLVKQLTGGDKVTARFQYENEFDFNPQFKLWLCTNHKPIIRGTDEGIWRRLAIVPFNVYIPDSKVDYHLKSKLKREIKGILKWAVDGFMKWQESGLQEPGTVKAQRAEYRTEMDSVENFINECCVRDPHKETKAKPLFSAYREWAIENNQYQMSSTKFGRELGKKFDKKKSNGTNVYMGIALKPFAEQVFKMDY